MKIISQLDACVPREALSATPAGDKWHLIAYEADGVSGIMVGAAPLVMAPDLTLALDATGWHAVYIGIWNPHHDYQGRFRVKVRLGSDPCFHDMVDPEPPLSWPGLCHLQEAFFKEADLTGEHLVIRKQNKGAPSRVNKCYVAYIRLEPLSDRQVSTIQNDRADRSRRRLHALNDGNGTFYDGPTTKEELLEQVEPYRHSDVGTVLFAVSSGDVVNYPSSIGQSWLADVGDVVPTIERVALRDSIRTLLDKGIVPIQVLAEHCHEIGVAFHAMFRMGIIGDVPPGDIWNPHTGFVRRRPDLRMIDRDGTPLEKASYAHEEVRAAMLEMIAEVCRNYDIDGVNLCFVRGPHYVGYEDVVIEDFRQEHGVDPRDLDENDERVQRHRASYVTTLVRSARRLLDEIGAERGRRFDLTAMCYRGQADLNLFFGLEILTWLREGLLDTIYLSLPIDEEVLQVARDAGCSVVSHLMPSCGDARADIPETIEMARRGFEAGSDGFWYWDVVFRQSLPAYWQLLRRIGHRDEVNSMADAPPKMSTRQLRTVAGFDMCHTTNRGSDERDYWPPAMLPIYSGG
ncbi:MAG: hypothetical protein CMJ18_07045 [Phycisphaeraceae bacterium]|nr:hypothetical protein [Phycisphaeraceae bacterium]